MVHILDVYEHYRFRAIEAELKIQGTSGWSGFLDTSDTWQDRYVSGGSGSLAQYLTRRMV